MWGGVLEVHGEVGGVEGGIGSRFRCFVGEFRAGGGSHSVAASPEDIDSAWPLCPVVWKVIVPINQSINGLYLYSQLNPSTNVRLNSVPLGKEIGSSAVWVMTELQVPSNKWSPTEGIVVVVILWLDTKDESIKQGDEPESIRVRMVSEFGIARGMKRESGSKRADALRWMYLATWSRSTQPSGHVAFWGLWTIFLNPWSL